MQAATREAELMRLERTDRMLRFELTEALVAARDLDKAARRGTLSAADAAHLLSLRSRQSRLHRDLAAATAALRALRGTPADDAGDVSAG